MIKFDPLSLYTRAELIEMIGVHTLNRLTSCGGLRALGGYYCAQNIVESFHRVWLESLRQHASGDGTEAKFEEETEQNTELSAGSKTPRVQPLPKSKRSPSIPEQIAQVRQFSA